MIYRICVLVVLLVSILGVPSTDVKTFTSGHLITTVLLFYWLLCNLTTCFTVHLQIEEISRRLRTGDLGIPPNQEDRFADQLIHEITTLLLSEQELVPVI